MIEKVYVKELPLTPVEAFKRVSELLRDGFQFSDLQEATRLLVQYAGTYLPGLEGKDKAQWVKQKILELVENYDSLIPVLGQFLDLPLLDTLEHFLLDKLLDLALEPVIKWVYTKDVFERALDEKLR
jgi:hypothetical protein